MMCDECGNSPAVFHLAVIVSGEKQERNLCAKCMSKMKDKLPTLDFMGFAGLLSGFIDAAKKTGVPAEPELDITCSRCGTTYEVFKKTGLLGCANCYRDFHEPLERILGRVHGHTQHAGRIPAGMDAEFAVKVNLDRLKEQLVKAIASEEYEEAAKLRDEIRAFNARREQRELPKVAEKEGDGDE